MGPSSLGVLLAGQHPGEFSDPFFLGESPDIGNGDAFCCGATVTFMDPNVLIGVGGHLGKMGHTDNLGLLRQGRQPPANLDRSMAADAGVDFIKDERSSAELFG